MNSGTAQTKLEDALQTAIFYLKASHPDWVRNNAPVIETLERAALSGEADTDQIAWDAVTSMMNVAGGMGFHIRLNSGQQHYAAKCIINAIRKPDGQKAALLEKE